MGFLPPYDILEKSWSLTVEVLGAFESAKTPEEANDIIMAYMFNNRDDMKILQSYIRGVRKKYES